MSGTNRPPTTAECIAYLDEWRGNLDAQRAALAQSEAEYLRTRALFVESLLLAARGEGVRT